MLVLEDYRFERFELHQSLEYLIRIAIRYILMINATSEKTSLNFARADISIC